MRRRLEDRRFDRPLRLEIVVTPQCQGCDEARAVAQAMRRRFPTLEVDLIKLDGRRVPPDHVVATPTYLLDGAVISLGNPSRSALARIIEQRQGAHR
jgi:hypothetical protein